MKRNLILVTVILIWAGLYLASCSTRRVNKDMTGVSELDTKIANGRLVFKSKCQKCHPNGEAGVGPALNDKPLPSVILRAKIRSKATFLWTGRMPAFDKHEISNVEMNALLAYLKDMRKR